MSDFETMQLKPRFSYLRLALPQLIVWVFIALITLIFSPIAAIIITIIFGIIHGFIQFSFYMNYKATNYTISKDKINFDEGFINHQSSSIKIKNIKEVHLTQSFIQRWFKLGTIRILTAGSNQENGGGLKLRDIDSSATIYTTINKLVKITLNENVHNIEENPARKAMVLKPASNTPYYTMLAFAGNLSVLFFTLLIGASLVNVLSFYFVPIAFGIYLITSIVSRFLIGLEYKYRKYLISNTKVESKEGFFNYHYSVIDFRNAREIRYESGWVQRLFGLGSIVVSSPANNRPSTQINESNILAKMFSPKGNSNPNMSYYRTGIKLSNLKEVMKTYKMLKHLNDCAVTQNARNIANDVPQYTYKPTFNLLVRPDFYLSLIFLVPLTFAWGSFIIASFFILMMNAIGTAIAITLLQVILLLAIIILPIYLMKKNYDCSKYEIYPTRIEFHEGFIKQKSSMILIENIREIHIKENFLQRIFHLGTIKIVTSGTTEDIAMNDSGEVFRDLKDCQKAYSQMKQFLEDRRKEAEQAKAINLVQENQQTTENNVEIIDWEQMEAQFEPQKEKEIFKKEFKPKFNFFNIFLSQVPIVFAVIIIIIIQNIGGAMKNMSFSQVLGAIGIGFIAAIVLSIVISMFIAVSDGLNYSKTKYEMTEDKLNFTEGFFNNNYTSVEYKNIREIIFKQNWAQRIFKLGTIKCLTSANTNFSGLRLRDIENPEEIYEKLKSNIKAYTNHNDEEEKLIMVCKPKFNAGYILLSQSLPICLILLITLVGLLFIPLVILANLGIIYLIYKSTNYSIFNNVVESEFVFVNKTASTIFTNKLREIQLKQGFIQRWFNLGTFNLVTAASGGKGSCKLINIQNPQEINTTLQEIVDKNNERM